MTYSRTRLQVAAAAALAAIVASFAQVLITPAQLDGSTSQMVRAAHAHPGAAYLAGWCEMLAFLGAALACVTLTGTVTRGRGAGVTRVGGWLTTVGYLALGFNTIALTQTAIAAKTSAGAAATAIAAMNGSPALAPLLVLLLGGLVFPVILGVGLARAGVVGWWYVAVPVLAMVAFLALSGSDVVLLRLVAVFPLATQLAIWACLLRNGAPVAAHATAQEAALA